MCLVCHTKMSVCSFGNRLFNIISDILTTEMAAGISELIPPTMPQGLKAAVQSKTSFITEGMDTRGTEF